MRNNLGQTVGTSVVAVVPSGKFASILRALPGLAGIAGSRGSVDFTANTGNIAVLGLRFSNVAFTSVPTAGSSIGPLWIAKSRFSMSG